MPSFSQDKKIKIGLLAFFTLAAILVIYFTYVASQRFSSSSNETASSIANVIEQRARLAVKPQFNTASLEDDADFEVRIDSQGELIKGVAFRVVFPYQGDSPFDIEDAPFDLMDTPVEEGWIVAVNTLIDNGEQVVADFSAINTAPQGFIITEDAPFVMLRVHTLSKEVNEGRITVDSNPSQLATSDGSAMLFEVVTETYTIK